MFSRKTRKDAEKWYNGLKLEEQSKIIEAYNSMILFAPTVTAIITFEDFKARCHGISKDLEDGKTLRYQGFETIGSKFLKRSEDDRNE